MTTQRSSAALSTYGWKMVGASATESSAWPGGRVDVVGEFFRRHVDVTHEHVSGSPKPRRTDVAEGHPMMRVPDFAFDLSVVNFDRDATGVREVLRMKAEDRYLTFMQFADDVVSV